MGWFLSFSSWLSSSAYICFREWQTLGTMIWYESTLEVLCNLQLQNVVPPWLEHFVGRVLLDWRARRVKSSQALNACFWRNHLGHWIRGFLSTMHQFEWFYSNLSASIDGWKILSNPFFGPRLWEFSSPKCTFWQYLVQNLVVTLQTWNHKIWI